MCCGEIRTLADRYVSCGNIRIEVDNEVLMQDDIAHRTDPEDVAFEECHLAWDVSVQAKVGYAFLSQRWARCQAGGISMALHL